MMRKNSRNLSVDILEVVLMKTTLTNKENNLHEYVLN